jgi:hypothetical protein
MSAEARWRKARRARGEPGEEVAVGGQLHDEVPAPQWILLAGDAHGLLHQLFKRIKQAHCPTPCAILAWLCETALAAPGWDEEERCSGRHPPRFLHPQICAFLLFVLHTLLEGNWQTRPRVPTWKVSQTSHEAFYFVQGGFSKIGHTWCIHVLGYVIDVAIKGSQIFSKKMIVSYIF